MINKDLFNKLKQFDKTKKSFKTQVLINSNFKKNIIKEIDT